MLDLAWISLGALLIVIVVSCFSRVNPGVLAIVLAWIVGVYVRPLFRSIHHQQESRRRRHVGLSCRPVLDAGRRHTAVHASSAQRHAAGGGPAGGAWLPGQRRHDPDHVLPGDDAVFLDRRGQHRWRSLHGAPGDGHRRAGPHPGVPHVHHGGARVIGRRLVANRADRHHRQRHTGEQAADHAAWSGRSTGTT